MPALSFLITLCLNFALLGANVDRAEGGTIPIEPGYPILRDIQYGFTIRNKTNQILKEAEFWTYAPVSLTSSQKCFKLEVSHPYQLVIDDLGNQILYFRFENLHPYAVTPIIIRANVGFSNIPRSIPINGTHSFLVSERYIESDHQELQQVARKFASSTPHETAQGIFHWVAQNISYAGYLRDSRGALYALRNKRGDCTEYMCLFAALCRANRIPARGIGGYVFRESGILDPSSYHNWAEFYEEGAWRISDPQRNIFMERPSEYIAMRVIGESQKNPMGEFNRFRSAGDGLEVEMMTPRNFAGRR